MRHIHGAVLFWTAIIMTTKAQDMYTDCSTNFTVLENALFETSDNKYQLSTTYVNPDVENPLYVNVHYNFINSSTEVHYIWSAATLYLIVPPTTLVYLSQFYGHVHERRRVNLTIQLPAACLELSNVTSSTKKNFLFVLTQRLRIYAKNYRSEDTILLPDGFEARVASGEERERFTKESGVKIIFSFFLTLPIIVYAIFVCYVRGIHDRLKTFLSQSDHYSSQAALVCVGQIYTLYVAIMDAFALSKKEITSYMFGIIITLAIIEFILFLMIMAYIVLFCISKENECFRKLFRYNPVFIPLFFRLKIEDEIISWFTVATIIPPLVCLSSHIGIIVKGWASHEGHGTSVMIFYSITFVYIFVSAKKLYLMATHKDVRESCCSCFGIGTDSGEDTGLNFCVLLVDFGGMLLLVGVLAYIAYGFYNFPALRSTDDLLTYIYNLGNIAFIFAVFLIGYIALYKKSTGAVSENVIKFWKYLNASRESQDDDTGEFKIESDADRANALTAMLLCIQLEGQQGVRANPSHCEKLLSEIMQKKGEIPQSEPDNDDKHDGSEDKPANCSQCGKLVSTMRRVCCNRGYEALS